MSGDSRKIHITRKGEQFGPYPEETARQFLTDGQLKATDLAWHDGADGWKPLPEVLGIAAAPGAPPPPPAPGNAPPSEPAAPAGPPPDTVVHISRNGERHGPYKYETAKKYLAEGSLKPSDSSWHEGLDGWKPLGELMGSTASAGTAAPPPPATGKNCPQCSVALEPNAIFCIQCGYNLQAGQGTQSLPGGGMPGMAQQPVAQATYSLGDEEDLKQTHLMYAGVAMIIGVVFPIYTGDGISFPNFDLSGASGKAVIASIWPLIVGITMAAMAKTTKDPVRCGVALGLSLFFILFVTFAEQKIVRFPGMPLMGTMGGSNLNTGGPPVIFYLGFFCLTMGCHARHMRPGNLPAYIISLVGGGFVCLNWLIPTSGSDVPLFAVFKSFNFSFSLGLTMLIFMGAQIAAAVFCFITTRSQPGFQVAAKTMLSLRLFLGSFAAALLISFIIFSIDFLRLGGFSFNGIKAIMAIATMFLKMITIYGGVLAAAPIASSCLLTQLMRR